MPKLTSFQQKLALILSLSFVIVLGLFLRHLDLSGSNMVLDYDQLEDQFYTHTVAQDLNPAVIGRAVYGDPRLHHGVFYYYYNALPYLVSGGNFYVSAYWNALFNVATSITLFLLAGFLFKRKLPGLIAALIVAVSFEFIKFSNWLTIDTVAIFLIPLFYLGLWGFYLKKFWSYLLIPISLGLCIQSDLSLLYLIPVGLLFLAIFKPGFPKLKPFLMSLGLFLLTISTLIITELKLNFSGIKFFLNFSGNFSSVAKLTYSERLRLFFEDFFSNFSNNLLPSHSDLGMYLALLIILLAIFHLYSPKQDKAQKPAILFTLFYLLSPLTTLVLGYHDTPWFLISLPGAIALITGFVISKLRPILIIPLLLLIVVSNVTTITGRPQKAYQLFDHFYDPSSYLAYQLEVIDYTYAKAAGRPFAINSVTYPLYYNALWEYLYNWYGKARYSYTPSWLGGDQLYPYNRLSKSDDSEKIYFMLWSKTPRIPKWEEDRGASWSAQYGKLNDGLENPGFKVGEYERRSK